MKAITLMTVTLILTACTKEGVKDDLCNCENIRGYEIELCPGDPEKSVIAEKADDEQLRIMAYNSDCK